MGMFGNFIAGAAGAGSTLLSQEALDDAKTNADLLKAQRVMDMQATQNEKLRVAGADRASKYFADVTETKPDVGVGFDENGNSITHPDNVSVRPATLTDAMNNAFRSGDTATASAISAVSDKNERVAAIQDHTAALLAARQYSDDTKKEIADQKNDTRILLGTDSEGNPILKGPGSGAINGKLNSAMQQQKIAASEIKELDKLMNDPTIPKTRYDELKTRQDKAFKDKAAADVNFTNVSESIFKFAENSASGTSGGLGAPSASSASGASGAMPSGLSAKAQAEWFKNKYNGNIGGAIDQLKNGSSTGDSPVAAKTPTAKVTPVAPVVPAAGMMQEPVGPPAPTEQQLDPTGYAVDAAKRQLNLIKSSRPNAPGTLAMAKGPSVRVDYDNAMQEWQLKFADAQSDFDTAQRKYERSLPDTARGYSPYKVKTN